MGPIEVVSGALSVNRGQARAVSAGLFVLAAAAIVAGWAIDPDVLFRIAVSILLFSVAVMVLARLDGMITKIIAWVLTVAFIIYFSLLFLQAIICRDCLSPPVATAGCMMNPWLEGCLPASAGVTSTQAPPAGATQTGTEPGRSAPADAGPVFIHFAGAIDREEIVSLASKLTEVGWDVEGANRGGERIASAFGFNEVRYFHPEDEATARALARSIGSETPSGEPLTLRNLSGTRFQRSAQRGHLEVWISN